MMIRPFRLTVALVLFVLPVTSAQDRPEEPQPSRNLLSDSSFESTKPGELPKRWSRWTAADGSRYHSKVVEGGRTGNKCLEILGDGIRGVVFTNGTRIEHGKRYALRGWAKLDGHHDARALVKFNYFHDNTWLGLHDTVAVTSREKDWQLLAKTDRVAEVPDASTIWISCVLEGKGTAWFDDLELVAYDKDHLPEDFDTRLGPSNRPAELGVLERRIGTWDTQAVIKPGTRVPDGFRTTGVETNAWTLGRKFILGAHKLQPGNVEALSLMSFDTQSNVFRSWRFDSNGQQPRGEMTGQWDESTQTLTFKGTEPKGVTITSAMRFVGPDRIEWQGIWRDKSGGIVMEMHGIATRRK